MGGSNRRFSRLYTLNWTHYLSSSSVIMITAKLSHRGHPAKQLQVIQAVYFFIYFSGSSQISYYHDKVLANHKEQL